MELEYAQSALEAVLFAAGEPMETERLAEALGMTPEDVTAAAQSLAAALESAGSGLRVLQRRDGRRRRSDGVGQRGAARLKGRRNGVGDDSRSSWRNSVRTILRVQ